MAKNYKVDSILENNHRVLIPDGEWEFLTNHIKNCFSEFSTIELYVLSNKKNGPSRFSRGVKKYFYHPQDTTVSSWIDFINRLVRKYQITVILPVYETAIKRLIQYQETLEFPKLLVPLPSLGSFEKAVDKVKLIAHLNEVGLPTPQIITLSSEIPSATASLKYPIIGKPLKNSEGGQGIHLFATQDSLNKYLLKPEDEQNLFLQEYITGFDIDCSVLCTSGRIMAYTIQKGIFYGKNPFKPALAVVFVHEPKIRNLVQELMFSLNWTGIAHIDLRYDTERDRFVIIEVNSRFWTSLDASLQAGVNFPYLYIKQHAAIPQQYPDFEEIQFYSLKGLVIHLLRKPLLLFNFRLLFAQSPLKFLLRDPVPGLVKIGRRVPHYWRRLTNR